MRLSYLNNAASSFPKPQSVTDAVVASLQAPPVELGRSGSGDQVVSACRAQLAELFCAKGIERIALLPSATHALNLTIRGLLTEQGSHVVTTELEHNSVLRPITHRLSELEGSVTHVPPGSDGVVSAASIESAIEEETKLIVVTHASNVTGCVQPIEEIAAICDAKGLPFVVDAAQSAGCVPIDHGALPGRVFIAFAGHKGLMGPSGTGGLILPDDELPQQIVGGTGIWSESERHPDSLPLRHEAGTPNSPGIAGLSAGIEFLRARGVENEGEHRKALLELLRDRLEAIDRIRLSPRNDGRTGIVSFTLPGWSPGDLAYVLRQMFRIETRYGLHCAPLAHRALGTLPEGNVRISIGAFNTEKDINQLLRTLREIQVHASDS